MNNKTYLHMNTRCSFYNKMDEWGFGKCNNASLVAHALGYSNVDQMYDRFNSRDYDLLQLLKNHQHGYTLFKLLLVRNKNEQIEEP